MKYNLRIDDKARTAITPDGRKIPVRDGKLTFVVQPDDDDIKNGIPGDHARCMYCLACKRMYNSELVWVTRGFAYLELRKKGKPELHRFVLRDPARQNIKDFDAKKDVTPEAVIFAAPTGSYTLDAQAKKYQRLKKAYLVGEVSASNSKKKPPGVSHKKRPALAVSTLRDPATGKFHFYRAKAGIPA